MTGGRKREIFYSCSSFSWYKKKIVVEENLWLISASNHRRSPNETVDIEGLPWTSRDATSQFPAGVSPKVNELLASVECGYHKVNGNLTTFYHHIGMVKIMTAPTGSTNTTSINYLVHAWSMWAHHHQIIILFGVLIRLPGLRILQWHSVSLICSCFKYWNKPWVRDVS